jgi:hypothetical protein
LKPAWATNAIYRIFDNDVIKAKEGRFQRSDCAALWSDEQYNYMHDVLIELMKNFRLVYEIANTGNLVAPQMLPQNTPAYPWDDNNNTFMQFSYDFFMPKGIFWQFVVTKYNYIVNHNWVWRNGVILERDGSRAEVIENLFERRIYIRFSGSSIGELRAIIGDEIEAISKSYYNLKYEKMIPCKCSVCINKTEPHFFKYSVVKKRQEKGAKPTIECEISEEDVPIRLLLEGFDIQHGKEKTQTMLELDNLQPPDILMVERRKLMQTLNSLVVQQFNELLFDIDPPSGIVPPPPASQGDRVYALLTWAESPTGCKLAGIQEALNRMLNPEIISLSEENVPRPDSPIKLGVSQPNHNKQMKTVKIFLASSSELKDDRKEFENFIGRKNKEYINKGVFLELVLWEDFIDAMSATRLQDEYNKAITGCDVFVGLFHTKVGKYTEEEFFKALETFKANGKLRIYTYFKDAPINPSQMKRDDFLSLDNFKQKLSDLGHYPSIYANIDELKHKFGEQLIKLDQDFQD